MKTPFDVAEAQLAALKVLFTPTPDTQRPLTAALFEGHVMRQMDGLIRQMGGIIRLYDDGRFVDLHCRDGYLQRPDWLKFNTRIRLLQDVERGIDFIATKGMTGTIIEVGRSIMAKMDDHIEGAETWDNCIIWTDPEPGELEADMEPIES